MPSLGRTVGLLLDARKLTDQASWGKIGEAKWHGTAGKAAGMSIETCGCSLASGGLKRDDFAKVRGLSGAEEL